MDCPGPRNTHPSHYHGLHGVASLAKIKPFLSARYGRSMQDDMKEHGGVLEYWWENQRSRKINPLPFAASPELSPRRNKQCLQYFDSCDTKNRRR